MPWLQLLSYFFGGVFLANAVPYVVSGMMGKPFQSAFARLPGDGPSSSTVSVLWGFLNAVIGYVLVCHVGVFEMKDGGDAAALGAGACLISVLLAQLSGRFNHGNQPGRR